MERRSAPVLLGLLVCLLAAHLSSASPALRLDESRIRVSLGDTQSVVTLELDNRTGRAFRAQVSVELLDPKDKVRASAQVARDIRRGANSVSVPLPFDISAILESERREFPWYRLRYRVAPERPGDSAAPALEGVASVSEVAADLFEIRVVTSSKARAGTTFRAQLSATNPATGRPVKGVAVSAALEFDTGEEETKLKDSASTDADGLATLDFDIPRHAEDDGDGDLKITARRGALVQTAESEVSLERQPRVLLTTDKSLYQPGQTLHVRALVFDPSEHAVAAEQVTFEIEDEEDTTAFKQTVETSRFGIASAEWKIPESARLGSYRITLGIEDDRYDDDYEPSVSVKVSRYDLPNFTVTAKPDRSYYLVGQRAQVEVRGDYLFGQPVKRGGVRVVRETERRWDYKQQKYITEESQPVEGVLDEQGRFSAPLDLSADYKELAGSDYSRYSDITFNAYVTDPTTARTEQRRFQVRITKEPIHLYVNEGRYSQAKGMPLAFYVSASYADGAPAECEVSVIEEGETKVETPSPGGPRHETKEPDRIVLKVKTNRFGVAKVIGPTVSRDEDRRNIPLRFSARDGEGRRGTLEEDLWLDYYSDEEGEVRVETDKSLYRAGEPIAVEVTSNRARLNVVVDATADGRVVSSRVVRLERGRAALSIPYAEEFRGAVRVTATSTELPENNYDEVDSGSRTVVYPRNRELKLDVRMSRDTYRPGEEADVQFAVRTPEGRRAEGALGVVVFDTAVEERARTEDEYGRSFGYIGSLYGFLYGTSWVAGITERDVEQIDLSRNVPSGMELVAELLFNNGRYHTDHNFFGGTRFERDQASVFAVAVGARLKPLTDALGAKYERDGAHPSDEASLLKILSEAGLDFGSLRDPWERPFRALFSVERDKDVLDLRSDGPDERAGTDDDFTALRLSWPYFRRAGERINAAAEAFNKRTRGFIRDIGALRDELGRAGFDLDALRDPWGQSYRFEFGVSGSYYTIVARSGGPNKTHEPDRYGTDDFALWTTFTDYFVEQRAAVDTALASHLVRSRRFPRSDDSLREVLKGFGTDLDSLTDGWGRRLYTSFSTVKRYADETKASYDATAARQSTEIKPVTATIEVVELRSAGEDAKPGTRDDFSIGYFTNYAASQSASDPSARPAAPVTTFSGGSGAITGVITDPQGAAVPGAKVRATHKIVEVVFEAETNEEGVYLLRNLPSGFYRVECVMTGFANAVVSDVQVRSSNLTTLDLTLSPGGVAETVTVTAGSEASVVNTTQSAMTVKIERRVVLAQAPLSTPRLRQFFPETLLWRPSVETDREGRAGVRFKLADNITTWRMSVIASTEDGRLATVERDFLAFQPFFVEHDPPRVLTEGDRIALPVVLRNYLERGQAVEVEMKPEEWFTLEGPARKRSEVAAGEAARPTFDFRAVASVKDGKQRVTALGPEASDAVEKPVSVHPDGEERSQTDATIFGETGALGVVLPPDVIRGSVRGELKIYPNLTAHLLEGVEAIMSRPYGCGEQTVSSTYPSVLVLDHFQKSGGDLDGEVPRAVAQARRYARLGYERLLGYRAPGGGFSYWGRGDADLALTAYALRFLNDAARVADVDESLLTETRDWLVRQQREDGSWPVRGWYGKEFARQTALNTAFIARVLAASPSERPKADAAASVNANGGKATPLGRALQYLSARIEEIDEPYLIASYALAAEDAGDRAGAARAVGKLRALAREEGAGTYWAIETNTPFYGWGLAGRIETTALAVLALAKHCASPDASCASSEPSSPNPQSAIPTPQLISRGLNFLLKNKDRYGVWYSTQATVSVFDALLGLVASEDAARKAAGAAGDAAEVFVNGRSAGRVTLPPPNELSGPVLLDVSALLGAGQNRVEIRRAGLAAQAQAQLVASFYVPWKQQPAPAETASAQNRSSALRLAVSFDRPATGINSEVTCSVEAERVGHRGYGMMLAEVGLPPGADVDRASLERSMKETGWAINGYDVLPDRLVLYLWPSGGGTKFNFKFRPRYGLDALTAPSQLYDYYNPEARTVLQPTRFVVR